MISLKNGSFLKAQILRFTQPTATNSLHDILKKHYIYIYYIYYHKKERHKVMTIPLWTFISIIWFFAQQFIKIIRDFTEDEKSTRLTWRSPLTHNNYNNYERFEQCLSYVMLHYKRSIIALNNLVSREEFIIFRLLHCS